MYFFFRAVWGPIRGMIVAPQALIRSLCIVVLMRWSLGAPVSERLMREGCVAIATIPFLRRAVQNACATDPPYCGIAWPGDAERSAPRFWRFYISSRNA